MSELLDSPQITRKPIEDRDFHNFRKSPQHGNENPTRAVTIEQSPTDPIPVNIVDGEPGTPKDFNSGELTTDGTLQTLLTVTVPVSKIYDLYSAKVVCRTHGKFIVLLDGSLIGSGRTGPSLGELSSFSWLPRKPIAAGQVIEIKFQSASGAPINDVEAYLLASERSA